MGRPCRYVTWIYMCHGGLLHPSSRHLHYIFLLMLSLPNSPTPCYPSLCPPGPDRPWCVMFPSLCPCVLIVHHLPMSENMWYFIFCSFVSLLKMMFSRFIHVPTKDINSSFLIAASYSIVYMCHIFPVQSIVDGHLGWFQVFAIVNSAAINILVHMSL